MTADRPGESGELSPIARAVVMNDIDAVRELVLEGHTVAWEPFPFEETALHFAAGAGRAEILDVLLDAGGTAYIDAIGNGWTALGTAANKGHRAAVQTLIARGADVNAHDAAMLGNTPLSDAVYGGFAEIVDDLLAAGADPMIPGWMNLTALDHAQRRNDRDPDACSRRILISVLKAAKG